jgi:SAM-dependent methyltransferase
LIRREDAKRTFGRDPEGYEHGRPGYPGRVYELLAERCGLAAGTATFEIGPGPGTATRRLLALGAGPVAAIEPDERLASYLESWVREESAPVHVHTTTFEEVDLEPASFDLGVCATAFHWIDPQRGLEKVARLLRPGGWWAMWWTIHGDPERHDAFHEATQRVLSANSPVPPPFALEADDRIRDIDATEAFEPVAFEAVRWSRTFSSQEIRSLYGSFSSITILPEGPRERLLDELVQVAEEEFGGEVERPLVTAMYTAQRRV